MKIVSIMLVLAAALWLVFISTTQHMVVRETAPKHFVAHQQDTEPEERNYSAYDVDDILIAYMHDIHSGLRHPLVDPVYPSLVLFLVILPLAIDFSRTKKGLRQPPEPDTEPEE